MSLISNIQTGGGLVVAAPKLLSPAAPFVPAYAVAMPSPQFPPISPPASSAVIVMEGATPPLDEAAAEAMGVELDNIPVTNDAAVLIDDVPTLALLKADSRPPDPPEKRTPSAEPAPSDARKDDAPESDKTRLLAEAAKRVYADERQISAIQEPPEPEQSEDPIPPP